MKRGQLLCCKDNDDDDNNDADSNDDYDDIDETIVCNDVSNNNLRNDDAKENDDSRSRMKIFVTENETTTMNNKHIAKSGCGKDVKYIEKENSCLNMQRFSINYRDIEDSVPSFDGEGRMPIDAWIDEFEEMSSIMGFDDFQKFIFAKKSLKGLAKLFVASERGINSYVKLKAALRDEFGTTVNGAQLHKMMTERKMNKNETVHEYFFSMKELASRGNIDESTLMQYVIDGINDLTVNKSILYGATNLKDFKLKLKCYETMAERASMQKTEKPTTSKAANTDKKEKNCFNCGGKGHESKNCKDKGKGVKCFNCNKFGHVSKQCPEKQEKANVRQLVAARNNPMEFEVQFLSVQFSAKTLQNLISPDGLKIRKIQDATAEEAHKIMVMNVCDDPEDNVSRIDIGDSASEDAKREVKNLVENYKPAKCKTTNVEMKIILKDETPIHCTPRRLPITERSIVDNQVEKWLQEGIIEPSDSEYSSPVVLVKKRNGEPRLCVDFRKINKVIVKDRFPLPLIEDLLDRLQDAAIFSTIDLKNGFFHVSVEESSKKYTSFVTHSGQYQFLKVPFGLSNSPGVFQRHVNAIFRDLTRKGVALPYIDDIITTAKDAISKLEQQSVTFGNPVQIVSDRGSAFTSAEFQQYCENEGILHAKITTGLPRANGQIERMNSIIVPVLAKLSINDPSKWYKYVGQVQQILNSTYNRSIDSTPFEVLIGVKMRSKDDIRIKELLEQEVINNFEHQRTEARKEAKESILKLQNENKRYYNLRRKKATQYSVNDLVAIKRTQLGSGLKLKSKYFGPYRIVKVKPHNTYDVVKVNNGEGPKQTSTCAEFIKPWLEEEDEFETNSLQDGRSVGE